MHPLVSLGDSQSQCGRCNKLCPSRAWNTDSRAAQHAAQSDQTPVNTCCYRRNDAQVCGDGKQQVASYLASDTALRAAVLQEAG